MYVNGVAYFVEELENPGQDSFEIDLECILPHKNNSATATINRDYSEEFVGFVENNMKMENTKILEATRQTDTGQRIQTLAVHKASTNSSDKIFDRIAKIKIVKKSRALRNKNTAMN